MLVSALVPFVSGTAGAGPDQTQRLHAEWLSQLRPVELVVVFDDIDVDYIERIRRDRNLEVSARGVSMGLGYVAGAAAKTGSLTTPGLVGGTTVTPLVLLAPATMIASVGVLLTEDRNNARRAEYHRRFLSDSHDALRREFAASDFDRVLIRRFQESAPAVPWLRIVGEPRIVHASESTSGSIRAEHANRSPDHDLLLMTVRRGHSANLADHYMIAELSLFARDIMPLAYHWEPFVMSGGRRRVPDWTDYPVFRKRLASIVGIAVGDTSKHPGFIESEHEKIDVQIAERAKEAAEMLASKGWSTLGNRAWKVNAPVRELKAKREAVATYDYKTEAGLRDLAERLTAEDAQLYRAIQVNSIEDVVHRMMGALNDVAPAGQVRRLEAR